MKACPREKKLVNHPPDSSALVDDGETQGEEVGQDAQHVDDVHAGFHEPEKSNPRLARKCGFADGARQHRTTER